MNISTNIETNQQQNIDVVEINDMMIDDCDLEQTRFRVSSGECYQKTNLTYLEMNLLMIVSLNSMGVT